MDFKDLKKAQKVKLQEDNFKAQYKKVADERVARPRAKKNIFSDDPRLQGI